MVANAYPCTVEYAADAHGVGILRRAGHDGKTLMVNTLTRLEPTEGDSGGVVATHPATGDRIEAVRRMR